MKLRKLLAMLALLAMVLPLLAACAKPTEAPTEAPAATQEVTEEPTEEATPEPTEEATPEPTEEDPCAPATEGPWAGVDPRGQTVVWWHNHSRNREEGLKAMVEEFNATNPCGITVDPQNQGHYSDIRDKMNAGFSTGDLPGLVVGYQNDEAFYALVDGLVDLNTLIDDPKWGFTPEEREDFYEKFLEQSVHPAFGGKRLGFPPNRSIEVLYYNKTWLNELGYENPPVTPEEFEEMACAGAAANGDGTGGYILRDDASAVAAWTFAFGGNVLTEDGTHYVYNGDATVQALTLLKKMYDEGCAYFFTEGYPNPELANRRAIFTQGSSSGIPYYKKDFEESGTGDEFDITAIPHTTSEPVENIYGGDVMIPKTSPEVELAAWLFIKWFTSPEQQAEWIKISNYFPTRKSTINYLGDYVEENPQWGHAYELLQYGTFEPQLISYAQVRDMVSAAYNEIMQGAPIQETLDKLTEDANALQDELMSEVP